MAKTRAKKETEVNGIADKLSRMKIAVVTTTSGLKVKETSELRSQLRKAGIDYVVAKKTLFKRALEEAKLSSVDLGGYAQSIALAFGYDDEVAPAKVLSTFARTHTPLKLLGGVMDGALLSEESVKALALLPTREVLIAQVVGTIAAPLSGFVRVLNGNLTGLVRVLDGYRAQRSV